MKAVVIVLLGCLPLTYLTVHGLLKPDADTDLVAADRLEQQAGLLPFAPRKPPSFAERKATIIASPVLSGDLLSGGTVESYPTAADRPPWVRAQQLLVGLLDADKPTAPSDIEASKQAKQHLQRLKVDCTEPPLPGSEALVAILERRIKTLADRVDTLQRQVKSEAERHRLTEEANRLLAEAKAAFKEGKYTECITLCDRLIEIHSQGIETVELAKLQEVKKLAAARKIEKLSRKEKGK